MERKVDQNFRPKKDRCKFWVLWIDGDAYPRNYKYYDLAKAEEDAKKKAELSISHSDVFVLEAYEYARPVMPQPPAEMRATVRQT